MFSPRRVIQQFVDGERPASDAPLRDISPAERYRTRFNKISIQATAQMAADKEAIGLSRVHMYESKCILPLRANCLLCS